MFSKKIIAIFTLLIFSPSLFAETVLPVNFSFSLANAPTTNQPDTKFQMIVKIVNNSQFDLTIVPEGYFVITPVSIPYNYGLNLFYNLGSTTTPPGNNIPDMYNALAEVTDQYGMGNYSTTKKVLKGSVLYYRFTVTVSEFYPWISQGIFRTDKALFKVTCDSDLCPGENQLYKQLFFTGDITFTKIPVTQLKTTCYSTCPINDWVAVAMESPPTFPIKFWKNKL